jgi:hypothetical protein
MANIQLLANPYTVPIYISSTNTLTPLITISINNIYNNLDKAFNIAINILQIIIKTCIFILREALKEIFKIDWNSYFTLENMICVIGVYNLFMLIVIDNQRKKLNHQKFQIESLEKHVAYLKKIDRMRDDDQNNLIDKFNQNYEEINKSIIVIDKKIKKIKKDIKIYE